VRGLRNQALKDTKSTGGAECAVVAVVA